MKALFESSRLFQKGFAVNCEIYWNCAVQTFYPLKSLIHLQYTLINNHKNCAQNKPKVGHSVIQSMNR